MSVFYRLHQDQSTGTKRSGKWYARAVPTACIGTRQLAEIIQRQPLEAVPAGLPRRGVASEHRGEGGTLKPNNPPPTPSRLGGGFF